MEKMTNSTEPEPTFAPVNFKEERKAKWSSRRLFLGIVWFMAINFAFFWSIHKGVDIEYVYLVLRKDRHQI